MDEADTWGQNNQVPVICNEFGVYRDHADATSRNPWIHDVRSALEADHIGWAMWDFSGNLGVVLKNSEAAHTDPAIVEALGLKQ